MLTPAPSKSLLLLIDFQQRLVPAILDGAPAIAVARKLALGARMLGVEILVTEQVPEKLGPTVAELGEFAGDALPKTGFSALSAENFPLERVLAAEAILVAGVETHVCVLQSVAALRGLGKRVLVVADAIGSRTAQNRDAALARMSAFGAEIVTSEMVLFEWLGDAKHPKFREISQLIK